MAGPIFPPAKAPEEAKKEQFPSPKKLVEQMQKELELVISDVKSLSKWGWMCALRF